jgi:putative endonuclease
MFCVYLLESKKDPEEWYVGFTTDLTKRLTEHNKGENRSTKPYKPWVCIYCEYCTNEKDARRREGYLKTTQGNRFLKRRLKEYLYARRAQ